MRVPIPMVVFLVLAVIGGMWWKNTRNMDFMTPPSEQRLEFIRVRTESSFPRADQTDDAISVPTAIETPEPPAPAEPPKPPVDFGDLVTPPTLQSYGERSIQGTGPLIDLAKALEEKGEFQRALLAWERVIDLTKPDDTQEATALSAIKRLRPTLPDWNTKPETAIQIILQAGTGKQLSKTLTPILESVALDIERSSAGIVKVKTNITAGKTDSSKGPTPVALWLTGHEKKSPSTEVLSFTTESPDVLRAEMTKTVYQLVRGYLAKNTAYTPPPGLAEGEGPMDALAHRITRLCWSEFATSLNLIPAKPEPAKTEQAKPRANKPKATKPKSKSETTRQH